MEKWLRLAMNKHVNNLKKTGNEEGIKYAACWLKDKIWNKDIRVHKMSKENKQVETEPKKKWDPLECLSPPPSPTLLVAQPHLPVAHHPDPPVLHIPQSLPPSPILQPLLSYSPVPLLSQFPPSQVSTMPQVTLEEKHANKDTQGEERNTGSQLCECMAIEGEKETTKSIRNHQAGESTQGEEKIERLFPLREVPMGWCPRGHRICERHFSSFRSVKF